MNVCYGAFVYELDMYLAVKNGPLALVPNDRPEFRKGCKFDKEITV